MRFLSSTHYLGFLLLLIFLSLSLIFLNDGHNWGGDFALYLEESEALINGNLNDLLSKNIFTVTHSHPFLSPNLYPIGYPLFLSLPVFFFGKTLWAYKLINILLLMYLGIRITYIDNSVSSNWGLFSIVVIFLFLFRDDIFFQLEIIGPDILFLVISFETLIAFYHKNELKTSIFIFLLLILRDVGLIYWLVFGIYEAYHRNIWAITSLILGSIYLYLSKDFSNNHWEYFFDSLRLEVVTSNIKFIYDHFINSVIPLNRLKIYWIKLIIAIFIFFNVVYLGRKIFLSNKFKNSKFIIAIVLITHTVTHLFWPSLSIRMLLIIELVFTVFFTFSIFNLYYLLSRNWTIFQLNYIANGIIFLMFVYVALLPIKHCYRSYLWCRTPNSVFSDKVTNQKINKVWQIIRSCTDKDAVIVFRKPRVLRYYTGRNSCTQIDNEILNKMESQPVYRLSVDGLNPAMNDSVRFTCIWQNDFGKLERCYRK